MADEFDLKLKGLSELTAATGSISTDDKILVVDPDTNIPRLELVSNLP